MPVDPNHIKILQHLPPDQTESLLAHADIRILQDGEILLSPEVANRYFYVLLSGKLKVALDNPDSPQPLAVAEGECVGEMSIIDGSPVSAYVIADGIAELLRVHEENFWQAVNESPGIARNLMHIMAERMRGQHEVARKSLKQQMELEHLAKELGHARRIQASMLPSRDPLLPDHPQLDIAASMEPAREVGGDYYDVFALDQNHVAIAIGDVSGKGMPASLFMVETLTRLRVELTSRVSFPLDYIVRRVNSELAKDNDTCMFTTLFLAVIDVTTGEMEYINGGHNHPLYAAQESPFRYLQIPNGMLIGVYDEAPLETQYLSLSKGDQFVLYTDGVTEAENADRELFSDERLEETLNLSSQQSARQVIADIRTAVSEYAGDALQSDDITMVAFRYLGADAGSEAADSDGSASMAPSPSVNRP